MPTWTCSPSRSTHARYPGASLGSITQWKAGSEPSGRSAKTSSAPTSRWRLRLSPRSRATLDRAPSAPTTKRARTRSGPAASSRR
ncbi:hypothetical protein ACFFX0_16115 [Citricoccus parietis]|uniref:Uncharacterized protein n=1 Tax=Citricoccus parietis TaxID=592307 RepID=A0ABV5G158_9MICC